jgi:hypothetical protein
MNERILELAKQAMIFSSENGGWRISTHVPSDFQEKFAELIVKECVRIAFDESAHAGRMNKPGNCLFGTNIALAIKEHFGVE